MQDAQHLAQRRLHDRGVIADTADIGQGLQLRRGLLAVGWAGDIAGDIDVARWRYVC